MKLFWCARPGYVLLTGLERTSNRMNTRHEIAVCTKLSQDGVAHSSHDVHAHHNIGRVSDLDADMGDGRADRAHAEWNHIHYPATHTALEQTL